MGKEEMISVPKVEWEEMKSQMGQLNEAFLRGIGIDPRIAARENIGFELVQFKKHYTRAAVPSDIQKGAIVIEGYSCSAGSIALMRIDEVERIMDERPELLNIEADTFLDLPREVGGKSKPVKVKDLIKSAPKVG